MLEFWRYTTQNDTVNSQSYKKVHNKVRQAAKTAKVQFARRVEEMSYDSKVWTIEALNDYGSELDEETWFKINRDPIIRKCYEKINKNKFNKNSFHSPPASRGIYVFNPRLVEWFIVCWKQKHDAETDSSSKLNKHILKFNGQSLWCHHKEAAAALGVQILEAKGSWIKIASADYKRVLKKALATHVSEVRSDRCLNVNISAKNIGKFSDLSEFEVFLVI